MIDRAQKSAPPHLCLSGPSGSGKTTLMEKLIAALSARGLRVGAIKHDAHRFEMDREGKDTWRYARAGAGAVLINDPERLAFLAFDPEAARRDLPQLAAAYFSGFDLVLAEGYKRSPHPKIAVVKDRAAFDEHFDARDPALLGAAAAEPWRDAPHPVAHRDDLPEILRWIDGFLK